MTKNIAISQLREKIADITNDVEMTKNEYQITRQGKVVAKIVPADTTAQISPTFKKNLNSVLEQYQSDLEKLSKN